MSQEDDLDWLILVAQKLGDTMDPLTFGIAYAVVAGAMYTARKAARVYRMPRLAKAVEVAEAPFAIVSRVAYGVLPQAAARIVDAINPGTANPYAKPEEKK